jgi:hypothetical protein
MQTLNDIETCRGVQLIIHSQSLRHYPKVNYFSHSQRERQYISEHVLQYTQVILSDSVTTSPKGRSAALYAIALRCTV